MNPGSVRSKFAPTDGSAWWRGSVVAALLMTIGAGLTPAMESPATSGELVLLPEMLSPRGMRAELEQAIVMRAAVREHPELINVLRRDGFYRLDIALNADGSVYRSAIAFFMGERGGESNFLTPDLYRIIPLGAPVTAGSRINRGDSIDGVGVSLNEIEIVYGFLPVNYDPSRAAERVEAQVRREFPDLFLPMQGGTMNLLTVLMTEDGRIARSRVAKKSVLRISEWRSPPDFTVLGLGAQQLGPNGVFAMPGDALDATTPAPLHMPSDSNANDRMLMVHYAWPRREGEPAGGPPQLRETLIPELQAPTITEQLASRYCAGAIVALQESGDVCWIVFTREGRVLRSGQAKPGPGAAYGTEQLRALNPDLNLTVFRSQPIIRYAADDTKVRLMFAWDGLEARAGR